MRRTAYCRRGAVDLLLLLLVTLPVLIARLSLDVYDALSARPVVEVENATESEMLAYIIQSRGADEQSVEDAQEAWHWITESARLHAEMLGSYEDPETGFIWYDTWFGYQSIAGYDECISQIDDTYSDTPEEAERQRQELELIRGWAIQTVDSFAESGISAGLERAADANWAIDASIGTDSKLNTGRQSRALLRACAARMAFAKSRGDWDTYLESCEFGLAIGRHMMSDPRLLSWLQGVAMQAHMLEQIRQALVKHEVPSELLAELRGIIAAQAGPVEIENVINIEMIETLGYVRQMHTAGGLFILDDVQTMWNLFSLILPKHDTTVRMLKVHRDRLLVYAAMSPADRRQTRDTFDWKGTRPDSYVGTMMLMPYVVARTGHETLYMTVTINDTHSMRLLGLDMLIAIELHRHEHGSLPASLSDLVPQYIQSVPIDMHSPDGEPLVYVVLPERDELGRDFLLYSVGADGTDDGGVPHEQSDFALRENFPGTDYIINHSHE